MRNMGIYHVTKNETLGRYMIAARNIKYGEVILTEKPTLIGSSIGGLLTCFNCCRDVTKTGYIFCRECKTAIICSPKCAGHLHSNEECFALRQKKVDGKALAENSQLTYPLRCLLLKEYNPIVWEEILKLESHLKDRRNTPIWRKHMVTVERILREINFITEDDLKNELVQEVCGILDVNSFEVRPIQCSSGIITNPEVQCLRGLYLNASLMAHDCIGNTHLSVDDDFVLTIHASVDIPEKTPIFFNYSNVLQGNLDRKEHLREGKYFTCSCARCTDPTELGTELSSLICHVCSKGLIRPQNTAQNWKCCECQKTFRDALINRTVEEGRRRIEDADPSNVKGIENLLEKLLQTFHPNHYLILELKQNLIGLYLRLPPKKQHLSRRIVLCQGLLEVLSKVEIGLSRLKAITLHEMHSAMVDLSQKQYRDKELNETELIEKLLLAESTLKESIKHLLYEPPKSPEGRLSQMALSELKMLRQSINSIQKDLFCGDNNTYKRETHNRPNVKNETKSAIENKMGENMNKIEDIKVEALDSKKSRKRNQRKKKQKQL
ncbi:hypothetical protein NQ317_005547 [Molorchus minor]|uniref:SET domain-containing protein n=1 Tax=Molorchus minor TaxID=1323400 RepID=A0ABQ9JWI8_9CUCU|nr:hypothetical protein NQ317_005547 [Molorchus minor]